MARKSKKTKPHPPVNFIMVDVDNPEYSRDHDGASGNPKKIRAAFNSKESPVMWMHARNWVTDSQAMAATEFRRLYEMCGGAGARAIDFTKEPVDGGGYIDPISDRRMDAAKELMQVQHRLGRSGYDLVERVCGQLFFIKQVAAQYRNSSSKRYETKLANQLKDCLDVLAIDWGYQTVGIRKP